MGRERVGRGSRGGETGSFDRWNLGSKFKCRIQKVFFFFNVIRGTFCEEEVFTYPKSKFVILILV